MSDTEKYMERAHDALETARILFENRKYNSAVSQAYYSMYYAAKALLSVKSIHPKTHKGVVSKLGLEFVSKGYLDEIYGKALVKALKLREKVDYDVYYSASEDEAISSIDEAEKFIGRIELALKQLSKQD
ncbi:HEPN domain-containing protein [Archaeoglobales archaeon]|nr:MAG: HEPN domain-containing protein [Archaeoglobales archaeon]